MREKFNLTFILVDPKSYIHKVFYGLITFTVMCAVFSPATASALDLASFTSRVKAIFLKQDLQTQPEVDSTSQTIPLFKSTAINTSSNTPAETVASSNDTLSVTSGPLRVSSEEIDFPLDDTISVYEVKKGDTLAAVAKIFNVSKNTIIWANDLKSQTINPGDTLVILPMTGIKHTVKNGDTVASLAKKYKADADDIAKFNGIAKDADLTEGDVILVPEGEISVTAPVIKKTIKNKKGIVVGFEKLLDTYTYETPEGFLARPIVGGRKTQGLHGHNAIDIAANAGTPVLASGSGRVILAKLGGYNGGYGSMVIISHQGGVQTVYAHLRQVNVTTGQTVSQNQVIGQVGNTGLSTGPHLHFEVRGAVNPF
jgi:murein DD-endopeptidase MepM/ murein hydrolase activator NlpD